VGAFIEANAVTILLRLPGRPGEPVSSSVFSQSVYRPLHPLRKVLRSGELDIRSGSNSVNFKSHRRCTALAASSVRFATPTFIQQLANVDI